MCRINHISVAVIKSASTNTWLKSGDTSGSQSIVIYYEASIRAVSLHEDVREIQGDSDCRPHKVGPEAARPICPIYLYGLVPPVRLNFSKRVVDHICEVSEKGVLLREDFGLLTDT